VKRHRRPAPPEFDVALHIGLRWNEQWQLRWQDVNLRAGIITIPHSKHGAAPHVPINSVAQKALQTLSTHLRAAVEKIAEQATDTTTHTSTSAAHTRAAAASK
jgi:integrase